MKNLFWTLLSYFILIPQAMAEFTLIPTKALEGCDFQTGNMEMSCIPNYIQYLITIIVEIAASIAVLFIMVGGFKYIFGAISEDKEAGKETIKHAIIGLVITGLAWIIVTSIVSLVTM